MKKFKSAFLKPLAIALVVAVALTAIIPIGATGNLGDNDCAPTNCIDIHKYNTELYAKLSAEIGEETLESYAYNTLSFRPLTLDPPKLANPTRSTLLIGANASLTSADQGDKLENTSIGGLALATYNIPLRKSLLNSQSLMIGSAQAGATTGVSFWVVGSSGSGLAYVNIVGQAEADLVAGLGGHASWEVTAELWDVTGTSTLVGSTNIFSAQANNLQSISSGGSFSASILASLQHNHCYVVRVCTYGRTTQNSPGLPFISMVCCDDWTAIYGPHVSSWSSVNILWQ